MSACYLFVKRFKLEMRKKISKELGRRTSTQFSVVMADVAAGDTVLPMPNRMSTRGVMKHVPPQIKAFRAFDSIEKLSMAHLSKIFCAQSHVVLITEMVYRG